MDGRKDIIVLTRFDFKLKLYVSIVELEKSFSTMYNIFQLVKKWNFGDFLRKDALRK